MDTSTSHMYSCSRQISQGKQRSYNVTNIDDDNNRLRLKRNRNIDKWNIPPTPIKRNIPLLCQCIEETITDEDDDAASNEIFREDDIEDVCDEFDDFVLSQNIETPYSTPSIVNIMRSVSQK